MKKSYGKKFCFYVNKCPNCNETTYISLRPHKQYVCKKCAGEFEAMKKEAGRPTKECDKDIDEHEHEFIECDEWEKTCLCGEVEK
jgi:hypothetical protein